MDELERGYFDWLYGIVSSESFNGISFGYLISALYDWEFTWLIDLDSNRADEGIGLRYRFALDNNIDEDLVNREINGPCSILEMMVALAIRCEDNIMGDPEIGDRTKQWFWNMITSLGLGAMYDERFDPDYIDDVLTKFVNRKYDRNGKGGLFTIKRNNKDLRRVEIWYQLCWYLDSLDGY